MAETDAATSDAAFAEVERALIARWPESRIDPTLDRIRDVCHLMGDPQGACPVIHLTGTNGKTSTSRMVDTLLRALGLRTGRFTSPHLEHLTERIAVDGSPLPTDRFVEVYEEVIRYVDLVDSRSEHPLSFFETITAMAFAAFADTPVDVAVLEVGLGGTWDVTNIADAAVAIVTPVGVDHSRLLGNTPAEIAVEKAGIIKPGSVAILAQQDADVDEVLLRRVTDVGASVAREGRDFGIAQRSAAVGGQLVSFDSLFGTYPDVFLPLHGAHQAHNAACAIAAVEAFVGGAAQGDESPQSLDLDMLRTAFAEFTSPGRLEVVRRSPTVIIDAAHNPHGARAAAAAIEDSFAFSPLIGVLGVMADKDVRGVLEAFEPVLATVICSQNSTPRSMPAEQLAGIALGIFGPDRVEVEAGLDDALERAIELAEQGVGDGVGFGGGGVLVSGSVITAGEARTLLTRGRGGERS
jgi:dihydrofolate synthase/folylpolyglutamate synthase